MQLVAASKMRKAQTQVLSGRPYSELMNSLLSSLGGKIDRNIHPLLRNGNKEGQPKIGVILIGPSRGLAGGLMSNLMRAMFGFMEQKEISPVNKKIHSHQVEIEAVKTEEEAEGLSLGVVSVEKKARDFAVKTGGNLIADFQKLSSPPSTADTNPIARVVIDGFLVSRFNEVYLIYSHFVNTMTQKAVIKKILPIEEEFVIKEEDQGKDYFSEYLFEPNPNDLLEALLPHYIQMEVYQAVLEAVASEHSARMVAMKNATDNALEMIEDWTLTYNQVRQANITQELLEITSAAAALGR
jgi:F-type H+-transporting ATPase subunit gamma